MRYLERFDSFARLVESDYAVIKQTSDKVDTLFKDLKKNGKDLKDVNTQKDLIAAIIDSDFNVDKIDVEDIKENNHRVFESKGGTGGRVLDKIIELFTIPNLAEKLSHCLPFDKERIQSALDRIKKILLNAPNWIDELISRVIFKIARFFGLSIETSKATSSITVAIVGICSLIWVILHFGAEIATLAGVWLVIKLAFLMVKSGIGIRSIYNKAKDVFQEIEIKNYTVNDFLDDIKPIITKLGGEEFSTNIIFALGKWYDKLGTKKSQIEYLFKNISNLISSEHISNVNTQKKCINHIDHIIKSVDKTQRDVIKFFQDLKRTILGRKIQTI